jgi:serine protease Do
MVPIGASHFWPAAGKSVAVSAAAADKADPEPTAALDAVQKFSEAFRWVAKKVQPSVVAVSVTKSVEESASPFDDEDFFHHFFGRELPNMPRGNGGNRPHKFEQQGLGSGVIIEADGYILTNNHVVAGADEIKVHLMDGRDLKAKVIGTDPPTDLALIQVKGDRLPALALGDSDKVEVGDWVLAIGAPFGLQETVTSGIISAKGRANVGISDYEDFLQTDAAVNPGNSGGPLVNMRGEVIGINTAIASRSGGSMGVGFAVPSHMVSEIVKRLRKGGEVVRGWLGVSIQKLTEEMAESMGLKVKEGVLVSQVFDGGPAGKGGLKAGDVIIDYSGKPVKTPLELQTVVAWTEPGKSAEMTVLRNGKEERLKITVEKRSEHPETQAHATAPAEVKDLGIQVGPVTPEAAERFSYKVGGGVLITKVTPSGLGAQAGLEEGMLVIQANRKDVHSVAEFTEAMKGADLAKGVPFLVRMGNNQIFVLIKKQ